MFFLKCSAKLAKKSKVWRNICSFCLTNWGLANAIFHYNSLYSFAVYCEPFIFAKKSHVQSISPKNVYICIRVGGKIPTQQGRHSKFLPVNIAKPYGERRTNARLCFEVNRPWCRLDKKQAWDRVSSIRSVKVFGDTYRQTAWQNRVSRFSCTTKLKPVLVGLAGGRKASYHGGHL